MKSKRNFPFVPQIYGIIVTSIMLLLFGTSLIMSIIENGKGELTEIIKALVKWYDDPTGFFVSYIIGYAIVWWKPMPGSVIIMLASLLVTVININNLGFLMFAVPTFLVGFFYIESWYIIRKKNKTLANK
jgi:hypothetical protein